LNGALSNGALSNRSLARALSLVVVAAVLACESPERAEAQRVVAAVDRFRQAQNPDKPTAADALRAVPCSAPDVCRTRDTCLLTADTWGRAIRLKSEVEKGLDAVEKGTLSKDSDEAKALPKKLDEAEALLKQGHDNLQPCDDQVMALRRKHRF
jgi:hypothetical protein